MNEFEKRMIDIAQRQQDLDAVLMAMGRNVLKEHFGYTTSIKYTDTSAAPSVQRTNIISIQSDAWFVMHSISTAVQTFQTPQWFTDGGPYQIQVTDTASGYTLYSEPSTAGVLTSVNNRAMTGVPFLFPIPHIIPPNANIKIDLVQKWDLPTGIDSVYVTLLGTRVAMI